jgi:hypothetical protein
MDAFWSGTDDANENMTQFYGVWGKINDEQPKFLFRWVCAGTRVNVDPNILFDIPQVEIKTVTTTTIPVEGFEPAVEEKVEYKSFKGPWPRVEAPEDWMSQHSKSWGSYNYGTAGKKTGTPSAASAWGDDDEYDYGYGAYGIYGAGGARRGYTEKDDVVAANARAQGLDSKKKDSASESKESKSASSEPRTEVEIFLEKSLQDDQKSIGEIEDTVKDIVTELIDLGYDYVISDTMQESSGYGYLHGRSYNARDWDY